MVTLRKLEPHDLPFLYQWENDSSAWAYGGTHNPLSRQDLRNYIESTTGDIYKDGQLRLIIEQTDTATSHTATSLPLTIGCLDLYDFDPRNLKACVGIYISHDCRQQGYALEALRLLDDYAFGFLYLNLLYAFVSEQNTASVALFSKAGYQPSTPIPHWTIEGNARLWWKSQDLRLET